MSKICWPILRVIANPLDTVSWHRMLMLVEGVGPKKAHDLLAAVVKSDKPCDVLRTVNGRSGQGLKNLAQHTGDVVRCRRI